MLLLLHITTEKVVEGRPDYRNDSKLCDAVRVTLGPKSKSVLIQSLPPGGTALR